MAPLAKRVLRAALPLRVRKRLAIAIGRSERVQDRHYWSMELVRDLADRDPDGFHRFLWSNHLAYAETYTPARRFREPNLHPSRKLLFEQLGSVLAERGIERTDIRSVLEVGCSLGYLLHHLETGFLPRAADLDGVDIDGSAVEEGARYLRSVGSRVRLHHGDMGDLAPLLGERRFDLVLCAGTLMYLDEEAAARVVASMLRRTGRLLVLTGLAHPERDNRELEGSGVRDRDATFVHNLDAMVERAGGSVVARRWEGPLSVGGNTIYFVFAEPLGTGASRVLSAAAAQGVRR